MAVPRGVRKVTATGGKVHIGLKNILFPTDFSPFSDTALKYAQAIARRYGSKILAAHVISPEAYQFMSPEAWQGSFEMIEQAARKEMTQVSKRLANFPHTVVLKHGEIWDTLSELIETQEIDLVVLGTHGRTGFERLVMGSVAEMIYRQTMCPVLTVGPQVTQNAPPEIGFRLILYATDFTPESLAGAPFAFSLAQEHQAKLELLHVIGSRNGAREVVAQPAIEERE
jgi:nucleotide-binding universal stress UspA family protein